MPKKINTPAPKAPEKPETEGTKAPDISPLISALAPHLSTFHTAEAEAETSRIDMIVELRAFRTENEEVERGSLLLALQTAIAAEYGLKIEHVQSKPDDKLKNSKPADFKLRSGAYQLSRELLGMAWAKDDKCDAKVAKALEAGETRFVVLKKMSQKAQANPARDPDANKITEENFAAKLSLFLTQAAADTGKSNDEVREWVDTALEAMDAAPAE